MLCTWTDCDYDTNSALALYKHLLADHWPWQLNRFVCSYCDRGWHDRSSFDAHITSRKHGLLRQLAIDQHLEVPCARTFASTWLQQALHEGKISHEHFARCKSYEKVTTEDIQKSTVPTPVFGTSTPVRDERVSTQGTVLYSVQDNVAGTFATQLPPTTTSAPPLWTTSSTNFQMTQMISPLLETPRPL